MFSLHLLGFSGLLPQSRTMREVSRVVGSEQLPGLYGGFSLRHLAVNWRLHKSRESPFTLGHIQARAEPVILTQKKRLWKMGVAAAEREGAGGARRHTE